MTHCGGYGAHGMLLEKMYDLLDEDQMRQLMIRMIESRIKMKQQHIEMMQHKIETYKMARDMLQGGISRSEPVRLRMLPVRGAPGLLPIFTLHDE
jgi:hypothetical protein